MTGLSNKVLVIGGGVGGIKAALDLAEAGKSVVLIDKAPSIGGLMTRLDRTFPTNNCDMCTLSPHLAESGRDLDIDIRPLTELSGCEGEAGAFTVSLTSKPRYIDLDRCSACGECFKQYPECVSFSPGLDPRAPTCMRYPQATPAAYSIDMDKCKDREALAKVCPDGAILTEDCVKTESIEVGAVIAAPGADLLDPGSLRTYGYGFFSNVVTGLEYERIMSASGPTAGELIRPSDSQQPKKVAWIQCAGSRNIHPGDNPYCSSVCCMYALKEAIVTKERFAEEIEAVVFYMDMRTSGKDYELYLERAKNDFNVRLVRCRPHSVEAMAGSDNLVINYLTDKSGEMIKEDFDLIVLSTGFKVPADVVDMSAKLGIDLNEYNFAKTDAFAPVAASKPGIYVCGLFQSPKDIPETLVQASACAGQAARHLGNNGAAAVEEDEDFEELPPERDVTGEEPRIGVFVYEYDYDGVFKAEDVADYARALPRVVFSESVGHGQSKETLTFVENVIKEKNINRVVIAGTSPRTHEILFQDMMRRAGLNKYLLEMANIRDQAAWVHKDNPERALEKAKELVRMAVVSVAWTHPLTDHSLEINKDVLVIGGGVTGMNAALDLADQGHKIYLVEKAPKLGGLAGQVRKTIEGDQVQTYITGLIERTTNHENIEVLTGALVVDHSGMPGLFTTGLQRGPTMAYRQIRHGVTILATGALAHRPSEYLLGDHKAVVTQLDLDNLVEDDPDRIKSLNNVVMIQCVGSRVPENPNCSRICCQAAIKNALRIKELNPETKIFILNRDIRTLGFQEDYYRLAREKGVIFVRYDLDDLPAVTADGDKLSVVFTDSILGMKINVEADMVALSTGMIADEENTEDLAMIFHLPRTQDNYFLEDHIKLRPVDLSLPGFFVAGAAHSPKSISECIGQAQAAAARALTYLARDYMNLGAAKAKVDGKKCAACLICVRACPFEVPFINAEGYSEIDPSKCQGCGVCAAACPAKAIELMQFEDDLILAKVFGLLEGVL